MAIYRLNNIRFLISLILVQSLVGVNLYFYTGNDLTNFYDAKNLNPQIKAQGDSVTGSIFDSAYINGTFLRCSDLTGANKGNNPLSQISFADFKIDFTQRFNFSSGQIFQIIPSCLIAEPLYKLYCSFKIPLIY